MPEPAATTDAPDVALLRELATRHGVQLGYHAVDGTWQEPTAATLAGVLEAMGVPAATAEDVRESTRALAAAPVPVLDPVVLAGPAAAPAVPLGRPLPGPAHLEVVLESGERIGADLAVGQRLVALADPLPVGYHRLCLRHGDEEHGAHLLVAPPTVTAPDAGERTWGVFAPLYSLRTAAPGPSVRDLDELSRRTDPLGARVVATLPLLAAFLEQPYDPSPYAPVSRRMWNELYVDLAALGEEGPVLDDVDQFDYAARVPLVHAALRRARDRFLAGGDRARGVLAAFVAEHPAVDDYARFRGAVARLGADRRGWPAAARAGVLTDADVDDEVASLHRYAQFVVHGQLAEVRASLDDRGHRLYLDLPVGAHADGFDTWAQADLFARGAAAGAPPDDFFTEGQNWGFPPMAPAASRAEGHAHLAACLRHHMAVAGILRVDHVMQLHRLYWVPHGLPATQGAYVRYPAEELAAVVAIESARTGCLVVGEDLGTVPDEVRSLLAEHAMLRTYVAEFALSPDGGLEAPHHDMLVTVDTHDTPTFAGFVHGFDIARRAEAGLLDEAGAIDETRERHRTVEGLRRSVRAAGIDVPDGHDDHDGRHLYEALLVVLGASDAVAMLVSLDDLVGETNPQNVPGTGIDRPNWVQRLPVPLADLLADPTTVEMLDRLQGARLGSHQRWREAR